MNSEIRFGRGCVRSQRILASTASEKSAVGPKRFVDEAWDQMDTDDGEGNPERRALDAWERMWLEQALVNLPPLHRMVIVLRHQEELSYEEISRAMNLPLGTVKTYLFRARRALREAMERSSRTG